MLLWRIWFFLHAVVTFFILYPFFFILLRSKKWFKYVFVIKCKWARLLLFNSGIKYQFICKQKLDPKKTYVFCPNHTSYLDIILSYIVIKHYFHFMGKAELLKVPFFNIFFKRMNIAVNRKSVVASHKAFLRASRDLDQGVSIAIFQKELYPIAPLILDE